MSGGKFSRPTKYRGVLMRSKLEVVYARFFDTVGINWAYEPGRYAFTDGYRYIPDFLLPDTNQFFEVKGVMTATDLHKIEQLARKTNQQIIIGDGYGRLEIALISDGNFARSEAVYLVCCQSCGRIQFMLGGEACRVCHDPARDFRTLYYRQLRGL